MSASPSNYQMNVHQIGLTVTWCFLLNFSVLCALLKYQKAAIIIHSVIGGIMMVMTYVFVLYLLAPFGFFVTIASSGILFYIHGIIGCALLGLVALQVTGGLLARFCQLNRLADIFKLQLIKNVHKYCGYSIGVLFKVNIIWCWDDVIWVFVFLIIWEICWICALIYFKCFYPKL